ncbi:hypothetical protein T484DRAFT_1893507 [Baffinella frigidus]|nr:hypothetical protein T484DRAFT_1893507 [Cryptophyta sp. CCMP2293]
MTVSAAWTKISSGREKQSDPVPIWDEWDLMAVPWLQTVGSASSDFLQNATSDFQNASSDFFQKRLLPGKASVAGGDGQRAQIANAGEGKETPGTEEQMGKQVAGGAAGADVMPAGTHSEFPAGLPSEKPASGQEDSGPASGQMGQLLGAGLAGAVLLLSLLDPHPSAKGVPWLGLPGVRGAAAKWAWAVRAPLLLALQGLLLRRSLLSEKVHVFCARLPSGRASGRRVQMWEERARYLQPESLLVQRASLQTEAWLCSTFLLALPPRLAVACITASTISARLVEKAAVRFEKKHIQQYI